MIFAEDKSLQPSGSTPSQVKKLDTRIDNLEQQVTTVADSVDALSNRVTTSSLNATSASINNATLDNATIGTQTATNADIASLNATNADIASLTATNADIDTANVSSLNADTVKANSVDAESYTGKSISVTENIQTAKKVIASEVNADVVAENAMVKDLEVTGDTTVRGDVHFPENGDKIYGEYLEVDADKVKVKSLTTETAIDTHTLVGYNANGNLIPVDATKSPAVLWEHKSGDLTTIVPKGDKKVEATEITTPTLNADDINVTDDLSVGGDATVDGTLTVNGDTTIGGTLQVNGETTLDGTTIDGTLQVSRDTTLADTTIGGTLQVNGDTTLGDTTLANTTIDGTLQVARDTTIIGNTGIVNNLNVSGDTTIIGNARTLNNLDVVGDTTISGNARISNNLDVVRDTTIIGNARISKNLDVGGETTISGTLQVKRDTRLVDTTIGGTLQVNGDIIQNGSAYETHAEKVYTKDDLIITRDGAVGALGPTEVTGIQAKKYDGTNDGQLVFDRNGEARVGDVGDTQPLLTRDELANMTDGYPVVWDGTGKKAKTGSLAQKDALNSGITSTKVNSIGDLTTLTTDDKTTLVDAINEVNTKDNLEANKALISNANGKVAVSDITSTELGYLDGVTSNIQTQLNDTPYFGTAYSGSTYSSGYFEIARLESWSSTTNHDIGVEGTVIYNIGGIIKISDFFVYIKGHGATVQFAVFNCVGRKQNVDLTATYDVFDTNKFRIRLYAKIEGIYQRCNTYIKYVSKGDVSVRVSNRSVTFPNTRVVSVVGTEITKNVDYVGNILGSSTTSTNATYATKIGTSSSHPAIGSTSQPVYVNANGEVQPCTSISGNPDVSSATGTLPIANGGTGATSKSVAKTNLGNYSGFVNGGNFNNSSITLTLEKPQGADNITDGDIVTVFITSDVKSSVAVDYVSFSFAGGTEIIDCNINVIKSHEYSSVNPNYNASYPHVVFKAGTTLTLMYEEDSRWHIIGNPDVETYVDASGNGYVVKADGFIRQWGEVIVPTAGSRAAITFPIPYAYTPSVNVTSTGGVGGDSFWYVPYVLDLTTTSFKCGFNRQGTTAQAPGKGSWFAIGSFLE